MATLSRTLPDLSKLEPLDGTNFKRWSQKLLIFFEQLDVDYVLFTNPPENPQLTSDTTTAIVSATQTETNRTNDDQKVKYERDNKTVRGHLLNHMSNTLFDLFVNQKSAKEIWETLETRYGGDDAGRKKYVVGKWLQFHMTDDKPIMDQVHEYENLVADVLSEGMKMCDTLQANVLLEKFPPSWSEYRNHLKHKKKDLNLQELISHMRTEEANRLKDKELSNPSSNSFKANLVESSSKDRFQNKGKKFQKGGQQKTFKNNDGKIQKNKVTCYCCGKTGHKAYQCYQRKDQQKPNHKQHAQTTPQVNLAETEEVIAAVVVEANLVENKSDWILDTGASKHFCSNKELFQELKEAADGECVYMGNSATAGVLGKGKVLLKLTSGKTLALQDVLYVPSLRRNLISGSLLNKVGLKIVLEADKVIITKNGDFIGKGYLADGLFVLNTMPFVSNKSISNSAYIESVNIWHGRLGHVNFDSVKRYTKIYLLRNKDEATEMFLKYKCEVENQLDKKIKRLRTDRGGEYCTNFLKDFCEKNGIIHETSAPYTPQQNGIAERKNRTLKEMMNAMLLSSGMPDNMWGEAVLSACYILNRVPHKKLDKTPYELWKGFAPNLSYLKVWGCLAKVAYPDFRKSNIGPKTFDCVFIGYAQNSAAYRFMCLLDNSFCEARNAEFFELIFPFNKMHDSLAETSNNLDTSSSSITTIDEIRRSKRQRIERSFGPDFLTAFIVQDLDRINDHVVSAYLVEEDPKTYVEAITSIDSGFWKEAIKNELDSIMTNHTWDLVDLPIGSKPIKCKWIFKKKIKPDGSIDKFKARLVVVGYTQKEGIDYFDTYSPVTKIATIRTLVAISAINGLMIHQMDVKTAFLNGDLEEEIYMEQPEGFIVPGLERKSHYIEKILKKFGCHDEIPVRTPYDPSACLKKNKGDSVSQADYAKIIGSVMFLMNYTRPDIAYAVSRLSRYTHNPNKDHWDALRRLLRYLKGQEAEWLRNLVGDVPLWGSSVPVSLHCDSQAAIGIAKNYAYNGKRRHIRIRHGAVKELLKGGIISLEYVRSERNLADPLTKGLTRRIILETSRAMGLKPLE
ncbi:UNVERIFIED_CONTAM: Retrovirus-related Pol polyprotein from transposon TNT 1-94 [Sesamum radiatum]|uniref:Retrovirus-related Pol polyprotein from transposon TNT 1-94 n=1 Tax=Sesamum radiatum TaxID=300843 RepID=A0AAW2TTD9_SESRA